METLVKRDAPLRDKIRLNYQHLSFVLVLFLLFSNLTFVSNNINANRENNNLTINILFEKPNFSKININDSTFTQITMKDCIHLANPGDPVLPFYPSHILIPYGKKIEKIIVEHNDFQEIYHNLKDKPIIPQQEIYPFSKMNESKKFLINKTKYNSDQPIFNDIFSLNKIGFLRGYKILTVYLYPVKYIPSKNKIYYTDKIDIKIEFENNNDFLTKNRYQFFRNKKEDQNFVKKIIENQETINTYLLKNQIFEENYSAIYSDGICNPENNFKYVIITSNTLKNTEGYVYNLSDLRAHRERYNGYNTTIVTVEEIDSCSIYWNETALFNDTQAHIREFCKDAYQNWNTEYILLFGDWEYTNTHKIVPYRLFTDRYEGGYYNTMACDMYYSHLDGDWYYADAMWGGGKGGSNDLYGELFVGRIACHDAETVSNAIYKIINYETNQSYQNNWLRNTSFLGGNLGWDITSKDYMEELRLGNDTHRTFTGFEEWNNNSYEKYNTKDRIYHADLGSKYKNYFKKSVENDNFSIINHLGHANIYLPFEIANWESLINKKPFFGYSQGCLSGRFHDGESGCEKLICKSKNRHAFALVLNTGYGYGSTINTDGPSQYINSYFWDYFLNNQSTNQDNWQIGKAMLYSQDKMASIINRNSHVWCYSWYSANLFGDPALKLRINKTINNTTNEIQINNENPINKSTNISVNISNLSIDIYNTNNDIFNWSIETKPDIGKTSGFNDINGSKICNISNLTFSTTYHWYVNTTDGSFFKNVSYNFITRNQFIPSPPINFFSNSYNKHQINLTWDKSNKTDLTLIEFNTTNKTWEKGKGIKIYNGSNSSFIHNNLLANTTYYYQAWSFNNTDKIWSNKSITNATTHKNNPPSFSSPSPENKSTNQPLNINWTIKISDLDLDLFNYRIEVNNGQSKTKKQSSNGLKYIELTNLNYNTQYRIWVNASDINDTKNSWYFFITKSEQQEEKDPTPQSNNNPAPVFTNRNTQPIAKVGGPYNAYVNEEILFNASNSYDLDDDILTYSWDFGDFKKGDGEKSNHTYNSKGNYTVTLTVSDGILQNTDTTYAKISEKIDNNSSDDKENKNKKTLNENVRDNDNDGISNKDEMIFGSDKNDSSDILQIRINETLYYLIDIDKDGKPDLFYNPKNSKNTTIFNYSDEEIYIDINGDKKWDYIYNLIDQSFSEYYILSKNEDESFIFFNYWMIFVIIIFIVTLITLLKFRKTIHLDNRLSKYIKNCNISKEGVFYFKESKKKEISIVNQIKNKEKNNEKHNDIKKFVDKISYSKNKKQN